MAWEDFLDHTCDIYHLVDAGDQGAYGIIAAESLTPEAEPSETDVPCHFHTKQNDLMRLVQHEPEASVEGQLKLSLGIGVDIRRNDIVYSHEDGLRYRAGVPREVGRRHHIIVTLYRESGVKGAL